MHERPWDDAEHELQMKMVLLSVGVNATLIDSIADPEDRSHIGRVFVDGKTSAAVYTRTETATLAKWAAVRMLLGRTIEAAWKTAED